LALVTRTVQAADRQVRGATKGLRSMAGYTGEFLRSVRGRPFLSLGGSDGALGWGLAFNNLAMVKLMRLAILRCVAKKPERSRLKRAVGQIRKPIARPRRE
jgi:hypothetical protein